MISRVEDVADDCPQALREALDCDRRVVVEQASTPARSSVPCWGTSSPRPPVWARSGPPASFYDYAAKYVDDTSELKIPAPLEPETTPSDPATRR